MDQMLKSQTWMSLKPRNDAHGCTMVTEKTWLIWWPPSVRMASSCEPNLCLCIKLHWTAVWFFFIVWFSGVNKRQRALWERGEDLGSQRFSGLPGQSRVHRQRGRRPGASVRLPVEALRCRVHKHACRYSTSQPHAVCVRVVISSLYFSLILK